MPTPYAIRPAQEADLDRLEELLLALQDHVEGANVGLWRMVPEGRQALRAQIAHRLGAAGSAAVVAEHRDDGVVGVAFGRVVINHRYEPPLTGFVDQVYVSAGHRRRGLASHLIAEILRFFAAEGAPDVSLRYAVGNGEAAAFWQSLGFAPRIVIAGAALEAIRVRLLAGQDTPGTGTPSR